MWQRSIIKANAKTALKGTYWTAFLVMLVSSVLMSFFAIYQALMAYQKIDFEYFMYLAENSPALAYNEIMLIWQQAQTASTWSMLLTIFVGNILTIGVSRYFVRNHFRQGRFSLLFSGFRHNYWNGVGTSFVTNLFIGLWTLLFIVPGIVRAIQYIFVPFLLSDNPSLPGARARQISRAMTDGEKGSIFVLELSFVGWYLLGGLCFVVGLLFVYPYRQATMAELYLYLRDRAIQNGFVNPAELGLTPMAPMQQQGGPIPPSAPPYGI